MIGLHKYIVVFISGVLVGIVSLYVVTHRGSDTAMPSALVSVPTSTVAVPEGKGIVVQDKKVLREMGAISKATAQSPDKAVTATGTVSTSDGTKTVAAVLDMSDWDTVLVEHRPFAEWMSRHEAGVGYGLVDGDLARAAQYRFTFGRVWRLYGTVQAEAFKVESSTGSDRTGNGHLWNVMAFVGFRW